MADPNDRSPEPRDSSPSEPDDIRPVVAGDRPSNLGLYAFLAILLIGGISIVSLMSAAREEAQVPRTTIPAQGDRITAPPPPALPQRFADYREPDDRFRRIRPAVPVRVIETAPVASPPPAPSVAAPASEPFVPDQPVQTFEPERFEPPPRPAVVFERDLAPVAPPGSQPTGGPNERVTASRFLNPARTIPQGTVIPAVLETALDSTRPGAVRALVQRDVRGFDGSRVLIGRGSRLYGEYAADLEPGQGRAAIRWTRLLRPDGVTIALDSPASDPLGRAGVRGKVDGKFFQRFGGALLQSVLDVGVGVATREATDGVIVALPGSTQNVTPRLDRNEVRPTLRVRHGTSVSVFVARDLDFSTVSP